MRSLRCQPSLPPTPLPHVFERRTSTGSEAFSLFICLDATKFVLPSFFSLTKTIYPRVSTKPLPMMQKVHFRLTTVAYELCSLSSLICLTTKKTRMVNPVRTVQYWEASSREWSRQTGEWSSEMWPTQRSWWFQPNDGVVCQPIRW